MAQMHVKLHHTTSSPLAHKVCRIQSYCLTRSINNRPRIGCSDLDIFGYEEGSEDQIFLLNFALFSAIVLRISHSRDKDVQKSPI